jgi:hypothetical protein
MQRRNSWLVAAVVLTVLFLGWGAMPALALYPPAQVGLGVVVEGNTVRYWVTDPMDGATAMDSWTLDVGDERIILPPQWNQGMVAWVAKYRMTGWLDYVYLVNYRIYDPGRGM